MSKPTTNPTIAFIPARGGSKGLPGKNTALLAGTPLYQRAVDQALTLGLKPVYISTDIPEILDDKDKPGVVPTPRPKEFSGDNASMADTLFNFLTQEFSGSATVVLLQPTSPLRSLDDIRSAIERFHDSDATLVMSVTMAVPSYLKAGTISDGVFTAMRDNADCFANRQALPSVYRPNGAVYVFDADAFRAARGFPSAKIEPIIMNEVASRDIDTIEDFEFCEIILSNQGSTE